MGPGPTGWIAYFFVARKGAPEHPVEWEAGIWIVPVGLKVETAAGRGCEVLDKHRTPALSLRHSEGRSGPSGSTRPPARLLGAQFKAGPELARAGLIEDDSVVPSGP